MKKRTTAPGKNMVRAMSIGKASPSPRRLAPPKASHFPNWAPITLTEDYAKRLLSLIEMEARGPNDWSHFAQNNVERFLQGQRAQLDFLHKLLTHAEMQPVWSAIEKKGAERKVPDAAEHFFLVCRLAMGFYQQKTKAERSRERKRLINTLRKASLQLESMEGSGMIGIYSVLLECGFIDPSLKTVLYGDGEKLSYVEVEYPDGQAETGLFLPTGPTMSKFIDAFALYLEDGEKNRAKEGLFLLSVTKPKAVNAPRTYFVLTLTDYLQTTYGDPLPIIVSATANVLFADDDSSLTPGHVSTLTKNILKKKN